MREQSVYMCVCVPAIRSVSMRGGGWGGLNILVISSSGRGGSPLLCRWAFSCCRLWMYYWETVRRVALEKRLKEREERNKERKKKVCNQKLGRRKRQTNRKDKQS